MIRNLVIAALAGALVATPVAAGGQRGRPLPLPPTAEQMRADLLIHAGSDTIYFVGSEANLGPPAQATLAAQAQWLLGHPEVPVRIEGHGDDADTRDHALAVGERRASAVRDFLLLRGVPAAQVSTRSWGDERPAAFGGTPAARALNRRAVTVITLTP